MQMAEYIPEPPLTEPLIVSCVYITGAAVEAAKHVVRVVGWVQLPQLGGEMDERRISVRFAMPIDAARALRDDLNKKLRREGH
jgi:hypothetical protein